MDCSKDKARTRSGTIREGIFEEESEFVASAEGFSAPEQASRAWGRGPGAEKLLGSGVSIHREELGASVVRYAGARARRDW